MPSLLCVSIREKVEEQIEITVHLISLLPGDRLGWQPAISNSLTAETLLGHLLDCLAGFCAVFYAIEPNRLNHLADLRTLPVNHSCDAAEATARLAVYRAHIVKSFELLDDARLGERVPTLFAPQGETLLTLLLGNLEHLINHKHQLFTYLKWLGVPVATSDLYRLRGYN
jgi:hypothetical protein